MSGDRRGTLAVDLGTTRTRVAYLTDRSEEAQWVRCGEGDSFPTAVALDEEVWRVGDAALPFRFTAPEAFTGDVKRHLGQSETPRVIAGRAVPLTDIVGLVLAYAENLAHRQAGHGFARLALAIPVACDGGVYRSAFASAAAFAGFAPEDVTMETEPEAAARAVLNADTPDGIWLVYDLGGGTFDAALLRTIGGGIRRIGSPVGRFDLSGQAIDSNIASHLQKEFSTSGRLDHDSDALSHTELHDAVRRLKHALTLNDESVDFLVHERRKLQLTPGELVEAARPVVEATVDHCTRLLQNHGLAWTELAGVLFTGSATVSPHIRALVMARSGLRQDQVVDTRRRPEFLIPLGLLATEVLPEIEFARDKERLRAAVEKTVNEHAVGLAERFSKEISRHSIENRLIPNFQRWLSADIPTLGGVAEESTRQITADLRSQQPGGTLDLMRRDWIAEVRASVTEISQPFFDRWLAGADLEQTVAVSSIAWKIPPLAPQFSERIAQAAADLVALAVIGTANILAFGGGIALAAETGPLFPVVMCALLMTAWKVAGPQEKARDIILRVDCRPTLRKIRPGAINKISSGMSKYLVKSSRVEARKFEQLVFSTYKEHLGQAARKYADEIVAHLEEAQNFI